MSLPWQSASPVPLAPLPKGGWHGEAVTGGFFCAPSPHTQKYRPKPWLRAVFLHNTIIHFMLPADYKPAAKADEGNGESDILII